MVDMISFSELKIKVYQTCLQELEIKVLAVQQVLADLQHSAANETKSTAGDKHETALAMLQLEQENKRQQLRVLQQQQAVLNRIELSILPERIGLGTLVETNSACFFIAVALGKLNVDQQLVYVISPESPLGKLLLGKLPGDEVSFLKMSYLIEKIV